MDAFGNELMKAKENEEDVNEFNDETFGNSTVYDEDWEWEKDHEQMAEALKSRISMETPLQPSFDYYDNDEEHDLDENDLKHNLSQLIVDDDEDENLMKINKKDRKVVDLEELFGPSSPPGLFPADELIMGVPNIWGSPVRDSYARDHLGGLRPKSLKQSLRNSTSIEEQPFSTQSQEDIGPVSQLNQDSFELLERDFQNKSQGQGNQAFVPLHPVVLSSNAKTVEEVEKELLQGGRAKTCWTLEDVERALMGEGLDRATPNFLSPTDNSSPVKYPGSSPVLPDVDQPSSVTHPPVRIPSVNPGMPAMPGVAPLPGPPFPLRGFGRGGPLPLGMLSPLPGPRPPPGIDVHHWNQGLNSRMPPHFPVNSFNYILASRAALAGFGLGQNRLPLHRLPEFPLRPGMALMSTRGQAQPGRPTSVNKQRTMHPTINPHHLLQHQQHFQQRQMFYQQHGYHSGGPGWERTRLDQPPRMLRREEAPTDEYAGLMQQREKDWIIKIQLLQLQTENPYIDDYYYTCWSIKKLLKEKQQKEGIAERGDGSNGGPVLVLPQLAKVETKAYTPVQFEGSLGKLTASSIHNPRQILDFHVPVSTEHEDGLHMERKRFKESLIEIEKCYDILLRVDDIEKRALAQPLEARSVHREQRQTLIKSLYQRLCIPPASGDGNTSSRPGLSSLISIHKGLLLAIRLLPLLEGLESIMFSSLLLRKLPLIMKKDWQQEDWPKLYRAIVFVFQTVSLDVLLQFASEINEESNSKNQLNSILSVLQNKLGISLVLALVSQGEVIYSTQSPLDLEADVQQMWRSFIQLLASAFENLAKDMLVRPLEVHKNVSDHFTRFLDKKQMLSIEDKLDVFLSASEA